MFAWWLLPRWRLLCLAVTAVDVIAVVIIWFWLPESPKYLVACGKIDEAKAALEKIARQNGKQLPDGIFDGLCESRKPLPVRNDAFLATSQDSTSAAEKDKDKQDGTSLFSWRNENGIFSPSVWLLCAAWFMIQVGTEYGSWYPTVLTNIKSFSASDRAIWLIIFNFCEIVSPFAISMLASIKLEHTVFACILSSCTAAVFARQLFVGADGYVIAAAGCLCSWTYVLVFVLMYTITPELFPTSVRNTVFGIATGFYRFGAVVAPLVYTAIMFNPKTKKDGSAKSAPEFLGTMIHAGNKKKSGPTTTPTEEQHQPATTPRLSLSNFKANTTATSEDDDLDAMESLFDLHGLTVEAQNDATTNEDSDTSTPPSTLSTSLLEQIFHDPHRNHHVNKKPAVHHFRIPATPYKLPQHRELSAHRQLAPTPTSEYGSQIQHQAPALGGSDIIQYHYDAPNSTNNASAAANNTKAIPVYACFQNENSFRFP